MKNLRRICTWLFIVTLSSCGQQQQASSKPNVILVCLDTVRADHLGSYGYDQRATTPFLDSLAARSLRFAEAKSTASWTKPSVPSIFTGLLPMQHGVYRGSSQDEAGSFTDILPAEAVTLAEVFKEHGYQTAAFVKNAQLRQGLGFEQGFDLYQDQAGDAREIRWSASDWLDQRDTGRPFFLYLHMLDAHWPYSVPEEYASKWSNPEEVKRIRSGNWRDFRDAVNRGERSISDDEMKALIALYDGSIRFMDDQLALLHSKLERDGSLSNTVICVVSDHGEEFLENGRLGHGHGLQEDLLRVPWILHRPGQKAAQISQAVSLLDLFPTLLAAASIGQPLAALPGINRIQDPNLIVPTIAEHLEPSRYMLSWNEAGRKTVEEIRPIATQADSDTNFSKLKLRGRWEVRFQQSPDGAWLATRLRAAKEKDSALEEIELKGQVSQLSLTSFRIEGIEVSLEYAPEYYGTAASSPSPGTELLLGQMVKARGNLLNGKLIARKIKRYGPSTDLVTEIRGPISVIDEEHVLIGSVPLACDPSTRIEFRNARPDLGAQQVAELLEGTLPWEQRSVTRYPLDENGQEGPGIPLDAGPLSNPTQRRILRQWLAHRVWKQEQREELTEAHLDDLDAIGY